MVKVVLPAGIVRSAATEQRLFAVRRNRVTLFRRPRREYKRDRVCVSIPGENGTPGGNRTHNGPLGGGCYIHLTTEAYFILNVFPPTPGGYLPKPLKGSPRQSVASLARTHNGPEGARAVLSIELRKYTSRYIIQYFQEKIKHFAADGRNL